MKKRNIIAVLFGLACFAFSPNAQAAPAPETPDPGAVGGVLNTADGHRAMPFVTGTATGNSAFGAFSLFSNTANNFNTAVGAGALDLNTADNNTAVGATALFLNTTGSDNTAMGAAALLNNTADANTAIGAFALHDNTTGGTLETSVEGFDLGPNTAVGSHALESNTDSSSNTAVGYQALGSMVSGFSGDPHLGASTAVGFQALANVNGPNNRGNDAFGYQALFGLTDGFANVAVGPHALFDLDVGFGNVAIGAGSGLGLETGDGNIYLGLGQAPPFGVTNESFHTYIGNIAGTSQGIGGSVAAVTIDTATGLLGHDVSSRRYKEDIKPMDNASETLYRLKPVTFRYKKEVDRTQNPNYGLIAEEVAKVDPHLAVRNGKGQIESVHYNAINAMLLNEFLKEHKKVQSLEATVAQQQKDFQATIAQLTARLEEDAAQIQRVSAQLEASKPVPQVVKNP